MAKDHDIQSAANRQWFSRPLWIHFVAATMFVGIVTLPIWWAYV